MSFENLTFTESGVGPLEACGEDLTNVWEVEEEERDANDSIEYGHYLPDRRYRYNMTITWKWKYLYLSKKCIFCLDISLFWKTIRPQINRISSETCPIIILDTPRRGYFGWQTFVLNIFISGGEQNFVEVTIWWEGGGEICLYYEDKLKYWQMSCISIQFSALSSLSKYAKDLNNHFLRNANSEHVLIYYLG